MFLSLTVSNQITPSPIEFACLVIYFPLRRRIAISGKICGDKMADERYNRKNPAVKRILQEVKEMQANPSDDFMSLPLEVTFFDTHLISISSF